MQRELSNWTSRTDDGVVRDMVKGAVAGAVGVWALDQVTWFMWNREAPAALAQEIRARPGGLDPAHVIANRVAHAFDIELTPKQPHPAGISVHYALGVVPGALYAVFRDEMEMPGVARGALYGLGLYLMQDQLANWMLGTSGAPTEYPAQAHVRGLAGHLVLGVVTDVVLDVFDRAI